MTANEPVLDAQRLIDEFDYCPDIDPAVVLVFDPSLASPGSRLARARSRTSPKPFRATARCLDGVSVVAANGVGAPGAAIAVEFLAAFGVERLVVVGVAGDLTGDLDLGASARVVSGAYSDEGTSQHYGADLIADRFLTEALAAVANTTTVVTATTDVPLRHTPERLAALKSQAQVVEMECAAVFAAANRFGLAASALLVISDHFGATGWQRATGDIAAATHRAVEMAASVVAAEA